MIIDAPYCPRYGCGKLMRASTTRDGYECRCGLILDVWEVERLLFHGYDPSMGVMVPAFVEAPPGIRVSERVSDLTSLIWDIEYISLDRTAIQAAINQVVNEVLEERGVDLAPRPARGRQLILDPGFPTERIINTQQVYALAPVAQMTEAARMLAEHIAQPGTLYSRLGNRLIRIVGTDNMDTHVRVGMIGGQQHVLLVAYYFHDPRVQR